MKERKAMYPGKAYSPQTTLAVPINATATEITLTDASVLPEAPNIAVIGDEEQAETILYTEKNGNILSGITRGIARENEAVAWDAGAVIARNITSLDLNAVQENIQMLHMQIDSVQTNDSVGSGFYAGVDLTERFADEIAEFNGNPWAWVQARIQDGNFRGINISDYIPFMIGNARIEAQVAGINTYTGSGDVKAPNHIDFIGRDLFNQLTQWNFVTFSNGTAAHPAPWKNCNVYAVLNGLTMEVPDGTTANPTTRAVNYTATGVFPRMPQQLRDVIVEKRAFLPNRYSATAILNNDSGASWQDIGKLWLPSETEITGAAQWSGSMLPSNHSHSVRGFIQYPLFAHAMQYRVKGMSHGANPGNWWTLSNQGANASTVVNINTQGLTNNTQPTSSMRLPICFRIA